MAPEIQTIEGLIEAMMRGEVPTTHTLICPHCGGTAHLAVDAVPGARVLRAVAGWCDDCDDGVEMDRVQPWPGWENVLRPPPSAPPSQAKVP